MRMLLLAFALGSIGLSAAAGLPPERSLVQVRVNGPEDCGRLLGPDAEIVDVRADAIRCLATKEQVARFRGMGLRVTILLDDYTADDPCDRASDFGFYHTYTQLRDSLAALAVRHPGICRLETLGFSVQNRLVLGLRISDNIGQRENEPRLRLDGNIHGNEKLGCEVTLYAAYALADSYGISPRVTALVNNTEILCVPMVNPDGAVANQRGNGNGVDLNRDFGYMWDAWGQSPDWFSQPETRALRLDCERNRYAMSISYHTGARVVIYPWMYTPVATADDLLFKRLVYAYRASTGYDTMRSYRWYQTHGQSFDSRYGLDGTLEITTELHASNPPVESVDYYGRLNQAAVLRFFEKSRTGISGTVRDAATGAPVGALIRLSPLYGGRDWFVYSSVENGDFHRPLLVGTYSLAVSANGYRDTLIAGVVVPDTLNPVELEIELQPGPNAAARAVVCVQQNDTVGLVNSTLTHWTLGLPDQRAYSMSYRGRLVLDMGAGSEIVDGPGADFALHEYPDASDTVLVHTSVTWNGPWTYIGAGVGSCSFDLAPRGVAMARYVKVQDASHRVNSGPLCGYDLDAVVALNHNSGIARPSDRTAALHAVPSGAGIVRGVLHLPPTADRSPLAASLLDISGRKVLDLHPGASDVSRLMAGVYFIKADRETKAVRVLITR